MPRFYRITDLFNQITKEKFIPLQIQGILVRITKNCANYIRQMRKPSSA